LEICSGGLTDAGVKNIKELSSLMCLNLSQNSNLTDKTVELIAGNFVGLHFCLTNMVSFWLLHLALDHVENLNSHV